MQIKSCYLLFAVHLWVSVAFFIQEKSYMNKTIENQSTRYDKDKMMKYMDAIFVQMKAFVNIDKFDSSGFAAHARRLSGQLSLIEEQLGQYSIPSDLHDQLFFTKFYLKSMCDASDALRTVDESSLAAEIMLRKVSDLKVRVLSMFTSKAEVPLSQIKNLRDVLSISNNLALCKIIFADLNTKPPQVQKNFQTIVFDLQRLLNLYFEQIMVK